MRHKSFKTAALAALVSLLGLLTGYGLSQNIKPAVLDILHSSLSVAEAFHLNVQPQGYIGDTVLQTTQVASESVTAPQNAYQQAGTQDIIVGDIINLAKKDNRVMRYKVLGVVALDSGINLQDPNLMNTAFTFAQYENMGCILVQGVQPYLILVERLSTSLMI